MKMKITNVFKYFFLFIVILEYSLNLKIKNKLKDSEFENDDPEMDNSSRIPTIHLHVEDHDDDPVNFRRFDGERKEWLERLRELEVKYKGDKAALLNVLNAQVSKLGQLTELAQTTNHIIEKITNG